MTQTTEELFEYYREHGNQYKIAGGLEGCRRLANDFYDIMQTLPEARKILFMHPNDLAESRDKLALFLAGYMDGPPLFEEKYGPVALGKMHAHLRIGSQETYMWMRCMKEALAKQDWPEEFQAFILHRLQTPASRIQNRP